VRRTAHSASAPFSTPVVVNGRFLGANPAGVQKVAGELLRAVDAQLSSAADGAARLDVTLVTPRHVLGPTGFQRIATTRAGRLPGYLWEQVSLPRFAKGRLLLNLCNLAPIWRPGVLMIHDAQIHISPRSYSKAFVAFYKLVQPTIARRAVRILTVSHYSKTMLVKYGVAPADKITVIHNGVDHMLRIVSDAGAVVRLGLAPGRYAVALSTTQAHKNIGVLLAAFADARLADAKLVLVGGATAADFEAAGHRCPSNVVFAGRVSDEALRALLESAACLAFPSTTEGFGLPPMEAMILGSPAVVAPCGALPEVCGDAAVYADAHDPEAWASAIATFIDDPEARAAAGAAARDHAGAFTWARSAVQLVDLVASLRKDARK
jgi:glycosyltransferase involved in cell wall biosynthesis